MRTLSTKFAAYVDRVGIERRYILKVTDGSATYYFSNRPTRLSEGTCYPLLVGGFSVKEGFDVYSKRWTTPTLTVSIRNVPIQLQDTGSWKRVSDLLGEIRYQDAVLYGAIGVDMNSTADMLVIADGLVANAPEATEAKVAIEITDRTRQWDKRLPLRVISEVYTAGPSEFLSLPIPLAYGRFIAESDTEAPTGLMRAVQVTLGAEPKFVVADHICDDITYAYLKVDGLPDVSQFNNCVIDEDDSGLATVTPDRSGSPAYFYLTTKLRPIDDYTGDYVSTAAGAGVASLPLALDRNSDTYAEVLDSGDAGGNMTGVANFSWDDYSPEATEGGRVSATDWTIEILASFVSAAAGYWAGTYGVAEARLYYSTSGGTDTYITLGTFTPSTSKTLHSFVIDIEDDPPDFFFRWIEWKLRTRDSENAVPTYSENDIWPFEVRIVLSTDSGVTNPAPNATTLDQWLMRIYDIRLKLGNRATSIDRLQTWAAGNGREYGSWITSRSSAYSAGAVIEDPVGIVESILRDELGLTSTRIDETSFIASENTSVKARLNLHDNNMITVYEIARQLAEQSTVAFYITAAGKWRAANLGDKTPTTVATIVYTDILPDGLKTSKTEEVVNRLLVSAGWREEFDAYSTFEIVEDTTSQTAFDAELSAEVSWPNIAGTSKDYVAAWLVNSTDGVWSKDHIVIELSLEGWKYIALDAGDTIELDPTSVDPHTLCRGTSWSGLQFLIVNKTIRHDRITLTAVKLY